MRGSTVLAATGRQVTLGDPSNGPVTGRRELTEGGLSRSEEPFCLFYPVLLEQGPAKNDLRIPYAVQEIFAIPEEPESVTRLLFGHMDFTPAKVDLRE